MIFVRLEQFEEAITKFQEVVQLEPNNLRARYNLGLANERMGNFNEARKNFEEALKIKPDFEEARKALESLAQ